MMRKRRPILVAMIMVGVISFSCSTLINNSISSPIENEESENNAVPAGEDAAPSGKETSEESSGSSIEAQEAETGDLPFPFVEDAYEIEDFFGTYTYLTNMPFDEVAEFYRTEMDNLGYGLEAKVNTGDSFVFSFVKEGSLVTMNIIDNKDGSVLVRYAEVSP